MAGLILIALIVILLFYIVLSKNSKKAFFISVVIVGVYMLYVNYACSPNKKDMKAMKPMAEAIKDYLIEYRLPKSLKDIPNLPYKLEECKTDIRYGKLQIDQNGKSQWKERLEVCHFKNITLRFSLIKDIMKKNARWNGSLIMDSSRDTGMIMNIEEHDDKNFYFGKIIFNGSTSGICNPMRQ
jgi:preprotein translocase subunit YajC